jgi:ABC-type sugar transport system permease subunit
MATSRLGAPPRPVHPTGRGPVRRLLRPGRGARRPPRGGGPGERRLGAWFVVPLLVPFALFYLWPALTTVGGSLFEWTVFRPWRLTSPTDRPFVGLDNYADVLTSERFRDAALNTSVWLVLFPALTTAVSLVVAILVWQVARGGRWFRALFVLPMTISLTAIGVIWKLMYNPDYGTVDALARTAHLDGAAIDAGPVHARASNWLSDPGFIDLGIGRLSLVNVALVLAAFWGFTGFGVITYTAGLTAVPNELVEAARVDGANWFQVVRYVLVPMLRGSTVIVGVVSVIFALRTFDIVWVMTGGGPANDTEVLAVLLWKQAFAFLDAPRAGNATAIAVVMSAVMVLAAYPYLRNVVREGRGGPRR